MGSELNETTPSVKDLPARIDDKNVSNQSNDVTSRSANGLDVDVGSNDTNRADEAHKYFHNIPHVYRQDIVRHRTNGVIGIVNEVAGDSDSDSSITDDEDDEDEEDENDEDEGGGGNGITDESKSGNRNSGSGNNRSKSLQADQVRVLWMDDTEPIQHVNNIKVVDRGFLHGDYVATASDPTGQVGVVLDVNISVDLLAPDGSIKKDISSRDLKYVRKFAIGDYVVNGPWLGRVDDILDNVTVLIDDGSVCKVVGAEPLRLKPISKTIFDGDDNTPYYPGQRVRASSSSVFKDSRWLSGFWKAKRLEGTVMKVRAGSVFIHWLASAGYGPDSSTSPLEEQSPNNLKLLSCFSHANWEVGDCCLLPPALIQSSSTNTYKGLSKLDLHDSIKTELDSSRLGNGCDSEEYIPVESDENSESMDFALGIAPEGNCENIGDNATPESSSCASSTSAAKDLFPEIWPLHRKKTCKVVIRRDKKTRKRDEKFERAHLIVNTRTRVDVQWQDGTVGLGLDSTMLIPIDGPGDHNFVAEQYVVEKASDDVDNAFEGRRVGVVKSVNAKERTACVRWLKPFSGAEDPRQFDKEEIVSVYELEEHPDYDYAYGDIVVRLSPVTISAQSTSAGESVEQNQGTPLNDYMNARKLSGIQKGEDVSGNEACTDFSNLSWVGNITGLRNGDIEVTWADGMVSTVGPQEIFVVGRDDDGMDSSDSGSEISDDAASWETMNDDDEINAMENVKEEVGLKNATGVNSEADERTKNINSGRSPALSLPLAAFEFVTRLATGIFSRGRESLDSDFSDDRSENECKTMGIFDISEASAETSLKKSHVFENGGLSITNSKGDEHATVGVEVPISSNAAETVCNSRAEISDSATCSEDDSSSFKRFDIAKDPLDHYFISSGGQINNGRKWLKKVQQDWNILQNNLPEGIYVRVYEDRMDLLMAVIVGAYGTPYQDGLFFFDFHVPPEYPSVPPSVHYHSGGWRINPNLYEEGKVCLSLLNTWTGRGNEVWDSMSSSILQVLVSLQGLVLNSKPYFNEAGYDKQIGTAEGEKNSLSYNENTFLLNCKTMMYLMRKPPKDFEELVKEHFRKRGHYILKACDAYMKGSLIGSLAKDASVSNNDNSNLTSVGFKLMLAKIVPKLYSALHQIGANCHGFEHLVQS